jgi:ATP-dependent RNA helicase DeaD
MNRKTPVNQGDFSQLGLSTPILAAIKDLGYEAPTPIQAKTIPPLLAGRDLIGQAQTGTGKTAAFAMPILQGLDLGRAEVQALVLTPTRELCVQVAEAIHTYSRHMGPVRVLPVYGGQSLQPQLRHLRAGAHVVVGTPGRIMDHLRRGTLSLAALKTVVLDEADEMLRMGFIDDVEWILTQVPAARQTALFSATMPREIRRVAERHLKDPVVVEIERKTLTVPTVEQRYVLVSERQKLEVLGQILESEPIAAVLVFVRTKLAAADLAERLQARGYSAEAMHGDMSQAQRESVIRRLRGGQVEIVVATDVAARGLDIGRISHVVNYDIASDPETYLHRIGRTGRAGRAGHALLFVTPREQRMLREIERFTRQRIEAMKMPTPADAAARRAALFKERIRRTLKEEDLEPYLALVEEVAEEGGYEMAQVAAASARLARGDKPLDIAVEPAAGGPPPEDGMVRLFIDAGRRTGVRPADIVGAIAGEAGVPGKEIGAIDVYDRFTFVEIPARYKDRVLEGMAHAEIRNRPVRITLARPSGGMREAPRRRASRGRPGAFSGARNRGSKRG